MNPTRIGATDTGPWYREPWPWALMSGPFIVIVAGLFTAYLAVISNDGLVNEDYYKHGLAINQTIAQSKLAEDFGLTVRLAVTAERMTINLSALQANFAPPSTLLVTVSHPTRAGLDQTRAMSLTDGRYGANFQLPAAGHWLVLVSDEAQSWRLMGNVVLPSRGDIVIGHQAQQQRQQKE